MNDVVAVATSGGRDSIALLVAAIRAAEPLGLRVLALHVHHGLLPQADRWARDLEALCAAWAAEGRPVTFAWTRLRGRPARGESVEAWARRERYAALGAMARAAGATLVLLAHHRRDQAETVLLQALRGAGPAGLAAMPGVAQRDGLTWARPWLGQASERIDGYVRALGLRFVVDPGNADPRHARSRLRTQAMPALRAAFPDAETALAAVARQAHEARAVLDEVAHEDLQRLGAGAALPLASWCALSPARRANALRQWLARRLAGAVPDTLCRRVVDEAVDGATRRWPVDATRQLRAWRGRLELVTVAAVEPGAAVVFGIAGSGRHAVAGWAGEFEVEACDRGGVAPRRLARVTARARAGGEQFQRERRGTARSLKKQYQAAGVPAEGRAGPLLFDADGTLLFAPGLGVDARAWADEGAPQWTLRWRPFADAGDATSSPHGKPASTSREPAPPPGKP